MILAFSHSPSVFAYDFSLPEVPSLPTDLPNQNLLVDSSTPAHSGDTNPASNWTWYGPITNTTTNNDVHVSKIANQSFVFGGWSTADSDAVVSNRVVIETNGSMKNVYGGYSSTGNTEKNIVEIFGNTATSSLPAVYGGQSEHNGDAIENKVFIRTGAVVYGNISGGHARHGKAEGNVVVVEQGVTAEEGTINGGLGNIANNNSVYIFGTVSGSVYAGQTSTDTGTGEANQNILYVGALGVVKQDAFASFSRSSPFSSGDRNVLIIDSGVVERDAAAVTNNVVGIDNELHLLGDAVVKGRAGANLDGFQENSYRDLNGLVHVKGTATVGSLEGFDRLIFELTDDNTKTAALTITNAQKVIDQSDPILDLTSVATIISGDELTDPAKGAVLISVSPEGEAKESLTLMVDDKTTFSDETGVFVDQTWSVSEDVVTNWEIEIDRMYINSNGELVTSLNGAETVLGEKTVTASSESHTLSESFLGTIAFVNQGAEFIADEGMRAMVGAAEVGKVSVFGAIHGGTSRYETGSHVDVDGVTLATGAVTKVGSLMVAGFVEAGWASSESHVSGTKGDGDHDYYGFGTALRYSFENPFYIDGSARFGWASTEFNGRYADASAKYDADSFYGSMHVGVGYVFDLTEKTDLDVYGRYVFTYLEGDTTGLGTADGERFDMDDTMTHAFRIGARLTGEINESAGWRFGLAYEHVADGDAESDVIASGIRASLDVPTLEGDTGIVEAGITVRPNGTSPWSANIGIKGYVGDREGVSGSASIVYSF